MNEKTRAGCFYVKKCTHFPVVLLPELTQFDPPQKNNGHRPAEHVAEAFALAEAEDLLRRQQSRAQLAPEGWHLDRGEEEMEFCSGETRRRKPRPYRIPCQVWAHHVT